MRLKTADILKDVRRALREDIATGDVTAALLSADCFIEAEIISREPMLVCGQPWVDAVFTEVDHSIHLSWLVAEGQWLDKPMRLCELSGKAAAILTAERTALNFFQTLAGTATQTHYYVCQLEGTKTRLLDTRKTLPGLRLAQKYAVACAGASNHRMGLYDAFLIKENHIKSCGSISKAIKLARERKTALLVEVEVETLSELEEAIAAKPDRILLDNFTKPALEDAIKINAGRVSLEVSGGVDLTTIREIAKLGVDYISIGAITKSVKAIDLSLLVKDVQ